MKKEDKMLAVWRHDKFPFLLTGEVDHFSKNGHPYIASYQAAFKTTCLMPLSPTGKAFKEKLSDLRSRQMNEVSEVLKRYNKELDKLKEEYGVTIA